MKNYTGKRTHLRELVNKMRSYSMVTKKFADILSGDKDVVLLGYPEKETAQAYGVTKRAKIILLRKYALHMDNSGHFTGVGYGKNGHNDPYPLTLSQISKIPTIIKTATPKEIHIDRKIRGLQRYKIIKRTSKNEAVVVEINVERDEIVLVTAYNIKKRRYHNR